jgi:hypothetical protein
MATLTVRGSEALGIDIEKLTTAANEAAADGMGTGGFRDVHGDVVASETATGLRERGLVVGTGGATSASVLADGGVAVHFFGGAVVGTNLSGVAGVGVADSIRTAVGEVNNAVAEERLSFVVSLVVDEAGDGSGFVLILAATEVAACLVGAHALYDLSIAQDYLGVRVHTRYGGRNVVASESIVGRVVIVFPGVVRIQRAESEWNKSVNVWMSIKLFT